MCDSICGVWFDDLGQAHITRRQPGGVRHEARLAYRPFAWLQNRPVEEAVSGIAIEELKGSGPFNMLAHAETLDGLQSFVKLARESGAVDVLRPWESQCLLQGRERLYADMTFGELRRCQLDIET